MKFTKTLLALIAVSCCFAGFGCGVARSYKDREHVWSQTTDRDLRMLVDDIDSFLMMDRPSRLTKWQVK